MESKRLMRERDALRRKRLISEQEQEDETAKTRTSDEGFAKQISALRDSEKA